jgi:mRNA-degrading endonuclease RelE of RelBE toxin-antitoxin system
MIYRRTERFRKAFANLPPDIQKKVLKAFELFKENPRHPSLMIRKMYGLEEIWEGRIDQQYRFTLHYEMDEATNETICIFRNIDNHDECLRHP